MNKKIVLLLTFIVSFIVSVDIVKAEDNLNKTIIAKEMTCVYEKTKNRKYWLALAQTSNGQYTLLKNENSSDINDINWKIISAQYEVTDTKKDYDGVYIGENGDVLTKYIYDNKEYMDSSNGTLLSCPTHVRIENSVYKFSNIYMQKFNKKTQKEISRSDTNAAFGSPYGKQLLTETTISGYIKGLVSSKSAKYPQLNCVYSEGKGLFGTQDAFKVTQSSTGALNFYYGSSFKDITGDILGRRGTLENNKNHSGTGFDEITKTLSYCPYCANKNTNTVQFDSPDSNGDCPSSFQPLERDQNNTNWKKTCTYFLDDAPNVKVTLNYNESNYELTYAYSINYKLLDDFTIYKIWNYSNDHSCPGVIYSKLTTGQGINSTSTEKFSLKKGNRKYIKLKENIDDDPGVDYPDIDNCRDLFGDDVIEIINKVMDIIKIIVPILLLIFGSTDFFTAVFSSSEENMKEHRNRFFKRIAAAIIVFLVPIFVNLVLKLANSVWSDIHDETCVNNN